MRVREFFGRVLLAVALLAGVASAEAGTICVGSSGCVAPDAAGDAVAVTAPDSDPVGPSWLVLSPISSTDGWHYAFVGGAVGLVSADMPFFGGWDPAQASTAEISGEAVHWADLGPGWGVVSASFTSAYAPTVATLKMTTSSGATFDFDVYIPLTPTAEAAGYLPYLAATVPEPSTVAMLLLGLLALSVFMWPNLARSLPGLTWLHPKEPWLYL